MFDVIQSDRHIRFVGFYTSQLANDRNEAAKNEKTLIWLRINAGDMKIIVFFLQAQMKNEKIVALVYIVCVWQDFAKEGSKARARARKE